MDKREVAMTLCPVALAVHCVNCPIVKVCPAKAVLGDYRHYPRHGSKIDAKPKTG